MSYNLFISYDLNSASQDYTAITDRIGSLGSGVKIQKSHWYVNSNFSAKEARDLLTCVTDTNDNVIVIDVTKGSAAWCGLDDNASSFINSSNWQ